MATESVIEQPTAVDDGIEAYVSPTVDFLLVLGAALQFAVLGVALLLP